MFIGKALRQGRQRCSCTGGIGQAFVNSRPIPPGNDAVALGELVTNACNIGGLAQMDRPAHCEMLGSIPAQTTRHGKSAGVPTKTLENIVFQ